MQSIQSTSVHVGAANSNSGSSRVQAGKTPGRSTQKAGRSKSVESLDMKRDDRLKFSAVRDIAEPGLPVTE